ncbi:P-loop containing nucleoside triphosphate hydrolase protein [Leptodontidium sp. 2 PMI_412]|nr:P-loop containing nucleoside triphosphate hydrolase protein [Leptodontidium sp. 2 PMI_412]
MAPSKGSRDARSILVDHIKKTYERNAFPQAWRNLPEIPSSAEIKPAYKDPTLIDEEPEEWNAYQQDLLYDDKLPHNIIDGPWSSKEAYLGAHYQIIREDSIASLRNAVTEVQHNPSMDETGDTCIYTGVTFTGLQLSRIGVASRVEFSCHRAGKRIRWDQSKRLVQGTIVALTPEKDMFKTICKVAIVAARPIEGGLDQDPPMIDLFWGDVKDLVFDPVEKYVMVESRQGYFEASRHTMVAMQKLMTERFSFSKELVELDPSIEAPLYVQQDPFMNLSSLERSAEDKDGFVSVPSSDVSTLFNVDVMNNFPKKINCGMDNSQVSACKNMLTKRLAIVQGPPGTGKTFVSISALEVMIRNLGPEDPPIIVAAQTNHALDQLLNHILVFEPEIVRLGGRSDRENVAIKKRTLYELRQATDKSMISQGLGASSREHRALCEEIIAVLSPLLNNTVLAADALLEHDIITEGQRRSLDAGDWAVEQSESNIPTEDLAAWLTESQLMPIEGAPRVNLGFPLEEGDIEAEQLQALEQEAVDASGPDDKESDIGLSGRWVPFGRKYTGRHSTFVADSASRRKLSRCKDLFEIPLGERGQMYRYFERQMNKLVMQKFQELLVKYQRHVEDSYITKSMCNIKLMRQLGIKVVGCTTTGLSKYRALLSALEPRTLLIEEAAETLECKIIAGMMESLQQLILVGDHKQLQASCIVPALQDEPYNLNISMFERLVNNSMTFVMLNHQRRMIPDVRKLLCIQPDPFYTDLHDHESVLDRVNNRPPVPGMGGRDTYFFSHNWMESRTFEGSCFNLAEANMIAEFFNYLVLNGVEASKITVLTFYNGQRRTIIKQLKKHPSLGGISYFNVFTVDSYQGEENDIILLSMVRSNQTLGVGFLDNRNRLVVALSRARRGLYLFGNSVTLTAGETTELAYGRDPLFDPLVLFMRSQGRYNIDGGLPVTCTQHNSVTRIYDVDGWAGLAGGCQKRCQGGILPCGHICTLLCHPFDHSRIICREACARNLPCGHGCSRTCGETCVCDECHVAERPLVIVPDNFGYWDSNQAASPASSQSPAKSAMKSGELHGSGHRQVRFNEAPNPYTVSDIRHDLHLSNSRVSTNGRQMPSNSKTGRSGRRALSDQSSGPSSPHHGSSGTSTPGKVQFSRSTAVGDQPPPLFRGYGHEPVIDKNHPGFQNWANYNAKKADQEIDEKQRMEAAKAPKVDPSTLVIKETYRPVIIKNGVRTADPAGPVQSLIPRDHVEAFPKLQTTSTVTIESEKPVGFTVAGTGQKQAKASKKKFEPRRDNAKSEGSSQQKPSRKQKRASSSPAPASKPPSKPLGRSVDVNGPFENFVQDTNKKGETSATSTLAMHNDPRDAIDELGLSNARLIEAVAFVPTTVEQPSDMADVPSVDLLGLSDAKESPKSDHVPIMAEQPGPWTSGIPDSSSLQATSTARDGESVPAAPERDNQQPDAISAPRVIGISKAKGSLTFQSMGVVVKEDNQTAVCAIDTLGRPDSITSSGLGSFSLVDIKQTSQPSDSIPGNQFPLEPYNLWKDEDIDIDCLTPMVNSILDGGERSNGDGTVRSVPEGLIEEKGMNDGLDLLIDYGNDLPVRPTPSHKSLIDESDDIESFSPSLQNGVLGHSDDLIAF